MVEILNHGNPDSQAVVLPLLAALPENSVWEQQANVQEALSVDARDNSRDRKTTRRCSMPRLRSRALCTNRSFRNRCWQGCIHSTPEVQRAAVRVCFEHFLRDPQTAPDGEDRICRPEHFRAQDSYGGSRQSRNF